MKRLFQIQGKKGRDAVAEDRPPRIFVTGATGYIGRAVVRELAAAGYEVTGLTRWAEKTLDIKALGARAVVGDVRASDTFRRVAAAHDVLIHIALESSDARIAADRAAIEALLWAARQHERRKGEAPRCVIFTSGVFVLGNTGDAPAAEDASTAGAADVAAWRPAHERLVLDAATEDIATAVIRPGMVYGGRGGLIGAFFESAERDGAAAFVGDGTNRWAPVYRGDLARLYRIIAERRARGIFHCAEAGGTPVEALARAASEAAGRGGAGRQVPLEEARRTMGTSADALVLDQVVASPRAEALGWRHEHAPFVESAAEVYDEWKRADG